MEPISLSEAKSYMEIDQDYTEKDSLISLLIQSSREWIEKYCSISLTETELTHFSDKARIEIPGGPVSEITGVKDIEGNDVVFSYIRTGDHPWIIVASTPVIISYTAGYSAENVPAPLREAILMLTQTNFENRESFVVGQTVNQIPTGVLSKIQPYSRSGGLFL